MREAPKSLLSLGDILNDYISLKEQKVLLEQEKCSVEKLLQGMQEVIRAYQSSDTATEIAPHREPVSPSPITNSLVTNPTPTSTNTPSPRSSGSFIPTVHSISKRNVCGPVLQPTQSTKKSDIQSSTHSPNGAVVWSTMREIGHDSIPAMAQASTGCSPAKPASQHRAHYSSPIQRPPIANSTMNKSSSPECTSPSPKTPPQQFATQNDSSHSPAGPSSSPQVSPSSSSPVQLSGPLLECATTNRQCSSSASENLEYCSGYSACQDRQHSEFSPSKVGAKKGEHVKGRLDFDDSVRRCDGASLPTFESEAGGSFNIDDLLDFSMLDSDVSLSCPIDFVMDSQVTDFPDHSTPPQATNLTSSLLPEGDPHLGIDSAFVELPLPEGIDVLREKDLNCQGNDDQNIFKSTSPFTKTNSPRTKKRRISSEQENAPRP